MGSPIELRAEDIDQLPPALADLADQTTFETGKPFTGANNMPAFASVDAGNPDTVVVEQPATFRAHEPQLAGHELTHIWQNNLPPTIQAKIPADNPKTPYNIRDLNALAAQGATMEAIPREQAATIVQQYIAGNAAIRKKLQPWIDQMDDAPLSALMPTAPDAKTINTTPRAPSAADALRYEDQVAQELEAGDIHNPPAARKHQNDKHHE